METEATNHISVIADLVTGIVLLLLVAALTNILSKKIDKLPLTIALVIIGYLLAQLAEVVPMLSAVADFSLTPELVLFVFIPTLIFESAFNLDARQVGRNILPILTLAVPGLIISTAIIGLFMWWVTPFDLIVSLLLGAILSATDPVAVISIFKQLGVPERLTILVEGESLFNDATSLVLATLLIGIMTAGTFSGVVVIEGVWEFLFVFFGGAVVGWVLALLVGSMLGRIESDPAIEITFTTILAYFSFIIAEHSLHVSGIMAVMAAGLMIGSWGKSKISPSSAEFMEHFWEYLAYLANVLIFLMVGMQIDLSLLWSSVDLIIYVVIAMLISRGVVVFGMVPILGMLPGTEKVESAFQKVMYWGGLRGAIALAIVLSLPEFEYKNTLVAIVMGAVLFTLLVQGLSIESLVRRLGLDEPNLAEKLVRMEEDRNARRESQARLSELVSGGMFSATVAAEHHARCEDIVGELDQIISSIHASMDYSEKITVLCLRCLAREKAAYYELFSRGLISEWAFKELDHTISVQLDQVRHQDVLPSTKIESSLGNKLAHLLLEAIGKLPGTGKVIERLRTRRVVRDYDVSWARYRAANTILTNLDEIAKANAIAGEIVEEVRSCYQLISDHANGQILEVADQYPEFVEAVHHQLGERLMLIAERETIEEAMEIGVLQRGIAHHILKDQAERIRRLNNTDVTSSLEISVEELLRKVPFFAEVTAEEFAAIASQLRRRTIPRGTSIIRQGQVGDSMFLIARGVAQVYIRTDDGEEQVATLNAGDFFGEAALLHAQPRNATAKAETPCTLYELNKRALDEICRLFPSIQSAVEEADRERTASTITRLNRLH